MITASPLSLKPERAPRMDAMEKYHQATRILASHPGRIKERLAIAVLELMDCQDCVPAADDWDDVREENFQLWRRLNSMKSPDGDPDVQGRIEGMTEVEACEIADTIYTIENKLREI
jgi:hypothetical protein